MDENETKEKTIPVFVVVEQFGACVNSVTTFLDEEHAKAKRLELEFEMDITEDSREQKAQDGNLVEIYEDSITIQV